MRTITSARDIDRLFREGRRVSHPLVLAIVSPTPDGRGPEGRVVFVAGKKLGGAVLRNRSKRVLREAVRRSGGPWPGRDIAVVARAGTATASPSELDRALASVLRRLEVTQ